MTVETPQKTLKRSSDTYLTYGLITLLIAVIAAIILLASVPPVSRDALTHHLFVPNLYIQHGGIYEIPEIPFSYYPMNLDLLYMIPMYFGNDIIPKYIHYLFALLTALLIFNYLKTRTNLKYAILGSLFFLTIPIIVKLSITVYVDLGLMFFTSASLLLLFRWLNSDYKYRYLILSGICCGLAAGTKYNGLICIILLPMFIPVLYIRSQDGGILRSNTKSIGYSLLFVLATLVAFSPWLVRNYAWTGNPIYPLHNSIFQQTPDKSIDKEQPAKEKPSEILKKITGRGSNAFVYRKILYQETWWQTLLLPIRFFFEGQDDNPRYFDGKLNPFLLILPFFAFLKKSSNRSKQIEKYTLVSFSFLFFFFTFFQETTRIRYIVCIIPPLVILSIFGLQNIIAAIAKIKQNFRPRLSLIIGLVIFCSMMAYNCQYISKQFQIIQPLSFIKGAVSRDQYIARFRPEFSAIQYANNTLTRNDKVLCIFLGNRGYYMDFKPIFDGGKNKELLSKILTSAASNISFKDQLLQENIRYILFRQDLTQNWFQHLNKKNQLVISTFFQQDAEELFNQGGHSFYRIKENEKQQFPAKF
jgi:4-amino-4-deoxy-L-arabinose transferase-like glycosyltransferase